MYVHIYIYINICIYIYSHIYTYTCINLRHASVNAPAQLDEGGRGCGGEYK